MRKRISKYTMLYGGVFAILCLITESLIQWEWSYIYCLSFVIGLFTGLLNLFITDLSLSRIEYNTVGRPRMFYTLSHISKFTIYGVVLYLSALFFGYLTAFTCAFGMLFHKIIIQYLYNIKDPKDDKHRLVDDLDISSELKNKLEKNSFIKVIDITNANRERLLQFLTNKEVEVIIKSLKKYELFIKGELEAIIDNDESIDI